MVPNEVKDYLRGLYGRAAGKIDEEVRKSIIGKEKPITCRPADLLEPMLEEAAKNLDPELIEDEEDIISFAILGDQALDYLKWRKLPPDKQPRIPADEELDKVERRRYRREPSKEEILRLQKKNGLISNQIMHTDDVTSFQKLLEVASKMNLSEIMVSKGDFKVSVRSPNGYESVESAGSAPEVKAKRFDPLKRMKKERAEEEGQRRDSTPATIPASINAPISGTFYSGAGAGNPPFVSVGDIVEKNTTVCTVEAMKLSNEIVAPYKCKILSFLVKDGAQVKQGDVLIVVKKL